MLAAAAAIGLSACGGGGDEPAAGEFADGACVDRTSATMSGSAIAGAASASNPAVVDCESPEAAGVLREVNKIDECPDGSGIGVFSVGQEGDEVTDGAFCVEPQ